MNRRDYAELIVKRIGLFRETLREEFSTKGRIRSFVVEDLFEARIAREIYEAFPKKEAMIFKNDLRERKYIAVQMNRYHPLLEEALYGFQDPRVLSLISEITEIHPLIPDEHLYAGGISLMTQGDYLNPHIDNSHDKDQKNFRVLNLLYYVTPGWAEEYGGNLELWDHGVQKECRVIPSKFNRLVVMTTGRSSWHSVSKVIPPDRRCCLSNYFFSPRSVEGEDYFHVTSFRGRPGAKVLDWVLQCDNALRNGIRKIFRKGMIKTSHIYQK